MRLKLDARLNIVTALMYGSSLLRSHPLRVDILAHRFSNYGASCHDWPGRADDTVYLNNTQIARAQHGALSSHDNSYLERTGGFRVSAWLLGFRTATLEIL